MYKRQTMGLSFISGIVLMIVGLLSAETILKMINTPDDVIGYAVTYIRVYFLSMIPMMIYNMGTGILLSLIHICKSNFKFFI